MGNALFLAALGLAACGSPLQEPVCITEEDPAVSDLVGETETRAREIAEARGLFVREVGRDGECFFVTADWVRDRVNLEIQDGRVVGARMG